MKRPRFYAYRGCGTCRKARQWLMAKGFDFDERPVREDPPTPDELQRLLAAYDGNRRAILNTSGADYRHPGVKEELAALDDEAFVARLSQQRNLIKRPVWIDDSVALAGFRESAWDAALISSR